MEALRVLVIEQDEEAGLALRRIAVSLGHTAIIAVGGEEALAYLQAFPFDAIVAEQALPDMDAMTLLRQVREASQQIPMIMLTIDGSTEAILAAYAHGVCDVVRKPVDPAWLAIALRRAADQIELVRLRHSQANVPTEEQIAYRYAHAINNPLSVIFGLVQLILTSSELPPSLRDDMQVLADNTMRITDIIKTLTQVQGGDGV